MRGGAEGWAGGGDAHASRTVWRISSGGYGGFAQAFGALRTTNRRTSPPLPCRATSILRRLGRATAAPRSHDEPYTWLPRPPGYIPGVKQAWHTAGSARGQPALPLPLAPPRPDPPPDVHVLLPDVFVVPGVPIRQLPAGDTYLHYNSRRPPFSLAPEDLPYPLPGYPKQMGEVLLVPTAVCWLTSKASDMLGLAHR